jgi:multiple sugar transport system ATP-binding protein
MLAGLEEVNAGNIYIGDKDITKLPPKDRDIAMVFQNYALYPHMTVRQNLAFGLKMRRTPKPEIERRVAEAAETLGITTMLNRRPRELSGGQRQRVALGRAIVRHPQVFLFDEPLSNLDAKLRVQMRAEIAALHQRLKTTMIYVTHDQVEAMTLGERIVIMDRGVVQQADQPLAIYRRPANKFVAGFIGSPPMNFLRGRLEDKVFRHADGEIQLDGEHTGEHRFSDAGISLSAWLGIRPEDIYPAAHGPSLGEVTLEVVEQMGHESLGYFRLAGERCALRLAPDSGFSPGDRLEPRLRTGACHLFADDAAGRRLSS